MLLLLALSFATLLQAARALDVFTPHVPLKMQRENRALRSLCFFDPVFASEFLSEQMQVSIVAHPKRKSRRPYLGNSFVPDSLEFVNFNGDSSEDGCLDHFKSKLGADGEGSDGYYRASFETFSTFGDNPEDSVSLKVNDKTVHWKFTSYILVTGGAGYIGSHAVLELLKSGYNIVVLDNLANGKAESLNRVQALAGRPVDFVEASISDEVALNNLFDRFRISSVIHFAGLKAVGESTKQPTRYFKENIGGTTVLLNVMDRFNVRNLIFSSSATVYGVPEEIPLLETTPKNPSSSPYGVSKHIIEELLMSTAKYDKRWSFMILRYFNPVGAHPSGKIGEDPNGIPNNLMPFISKVAVGKLDHLDIFGDDYNTPDRTAIRDYIHVVDLVLGHVQALERMKPESGVKIYNLGTGQGFSVREVHRSFEQSSKKKIPYEMKPRRDGDVQELIANADLAEKELEWTAEKGLDDMTESAWKFQSENQDGYPNAKFRKLDMLTETE